jgi:NADPH:quinone reductase-like Zn-dependent oxidoreductase
MMLGMYAMGQKSWRANAPLVRVEMETPEPRPHQVRVAVHAVGVNPVDWKMRSHGPLRLAARLLRPLRGPRGPVIVGVDFAGVVEATGAEVKELEVGTRVVGGTNFARGQHGSYADTVVVEDDQVCVLPDSVPFVVAGALPVAGVTAWRALFDFRRVGPGRRVLVLGASGGVGQFAVQIAKRVCQADLVAGVCSSKNAALVRDLGADVAVEYDHGDALDMARAHGPFDVIVDCVGTYSGSSCRALLARGGRHVLVAGDSPAAMLQVLVPPFRSRAILGRPNGQRLRGLVDAVAESKVQVHIAERLPLLEAEAALAKSKTGRMTGKLVLLPR